MHDLRIRLGDRYRQARDVDPAWHQPTLRSIPETACPSPSARRLTPMLNRAMHTTGATTAHGCTDRPMLFSLIIKPQSACGGEIPKPRKLIAETSEIDHAILRPSSTR